MIERLTLDEWTEFDAVHPAPTFFARPAWALALAEVNAGMQAAPLRVRLRSGRRVIVPLMQVAGGPMRWREFSGFPLGAYTCFLYEDATPATAEDAEEALAAIARFADSVSMVPWPLAPVPAAGTNAAHETAVVDLSGGIDAAMTRVAGIFRRMAGQAERRGVVCAPSNDADAPATYYELLEASAKRWGLERPAIPKRLIEALVRHGGDDVEIWFAHAEGRAIAGGIVFYGAEEFFFWSAAMLAEYGRLRPSNALNFALMRAAAGRGMLWYNLGSSEGLPGVAKFKENLGATDVKYHDLRLTRTPYRLYANVRRALTARASA